MSYKIIFASESVISNDISKIGKNELSNIFGKIEQLKEDGIKNAQVKKLKNYKISDFRLRVGNYRILFNYNLQTKTIVIFRILHRSRLY